MGRVNISVPDDVIAAARTAGLNVSAIASAALAAELERREKISAVEEYLAELLEEQGPPTPEEIAEAEAWADRVFGTEPVPRTA